MAKKIQKSLSILKNKHIIKTKDKENKHLLKITHININNNNKPKPPTRTEKN